MKIAFGCDHAGVKFKTKIFEFLKTLSHEIIDCGCFNEQSCDYIDFGYTVAKYVSKGTCEKGILICGTGIGMSITANKVPGIRAAVCFSEEIAKLVSEHNNANILCLSGRFFNIETLLRWIKIWLETPFSNEERHLRRINKIKEIEKEICGGKIK